MVVSNHDHQVRYGDANKASKMTGDNCKKVFNLQKRIWIYYVRWFIKSNLTKSINLSRNNLNKEGAKVLSTFLESIQVYIHRYIW